MGKKDLYAVAQKLKNDEITVACYEAAVQEGRFDSAQVTGRVHCSLADAAEARQTLLDLELLVDAGPDEPAVLIDPGTAEVALTIPLERDIAERQDLIMRVREGLRPLAAIYAQRRRSEGVRTIEEPVAVRAELDAVARRCRNEVLTVQPGGGRRARTLQAALVRDKAMLDSGVSMRVLYQHTARTSAATRQYVRVVTDAGAQVRTTPELPERLIIFDRQTAFVPIPHDHSEPPGAVVVGEPALVSYLYRSFESVWQSGTDFDPDNVQYEQSGDDLRASILRLMVLGHKDAMIARKLGLSTRSTRRYISALTDQLGAISRFQAGVRAAQFGLVGDLPPIDPDAEVDLDDDPE
jgi:DNA-binding CsgD family transcriptional regulator